MRVVSLSANISNRSKLNPSSGFFHSASVGGLGHFRLDLIFLSASKCLRIVA